MNNPPYEVVYRLNIFDSNNELIEVDEYTGDDACVKAYEKYGWAESCGYRVWQERIERREKRCPELRVVIPEIGPNSGTI